MILTRHDRLGDVILVAVQIDADDDQAARLTAIAGATVTRDLDPDDETALGTVTVAFAWDAESGDYLEETKRLIEEATTQITVEPEPLGGTGEPL